MKINDYIYKKNEMKTIKIITIKGMQVIVKEMLVGELDRALCSPKFLSKNFPQDKVVNVKCYEDGSIDFRGKRGQYRLIPEDKI